LLPETHKSITRLNLNALHKKIILFSFIAALSVDEAKSQITNPDLKAIVDTERAFAKMARDQNTRDAFLFYMADSVVTSGKEGPIIGKENFKQQKVTNSWLNWDIAFADVDASGTLGYTSGPWEFRTNKTDDKPTAYGEFNSIWRKQANGSWKNILDIGVSHGKGPSVESTKMYASTIYPGSQKTVTTGKELIVLEKIFISEFTENPKKVYQKYLSKESRIIHEGQLPITTIEQKQKFILQPEPLSNIILIGGYLPPSGDLGYVYGKATIQVNKNGNTESKTATYLRVWKKKNSWKIVLDVLTY